MGQYAVEVNKLAMQMIGAITESLGIGEAYLSDKMEKGMQVMAINCYPPCPQPELTLGLPPHSDYSCFTIVLHSSQGLEILDSRNDTWQMVPDLKGALQVHVGDHVEVLSNGLYKSVVHRVTLNREETRISIACLHIVWDWMRKWQLQTSLLTKIIQENIRKVASRISLIFSPKMILLKGRASLRHLRFK